MFFYFKGIRCDKKIWEQKEFCQEDVDWQTFSTLKREKKLLGYNNLKEPPCPFLHHHGG